MSENWRVQASLKFGPADMLNIRGDNADEVLAAAAYLTNHLAGDNTLGELRDALNGVSTAQALQNVQQGFPNAQQAFQPPEPQRMWPNQANAGPPHCAHGPMKDLGHKGYQHRYYCPLPKGAPGVCAAKD